MNKLTPAVFLAAALLLAGCGPRSPEELAQEKAIAEKALEQKHKMELEILLKKEREDAARREAELKKEMKKMEDDRKAAEMFYGFLEFVLFCVSIVASVTIWRILTLRHRVAS